MTRTDTRTLSEHESNRVLADAGVPVLDERVVDTPADAVRAARELGPDALVVVKLCGEGLHGDPQHALEEVQQRALEQLRFLLPSSEAALA